MYSLVACPRMRLSRVANARASSVLTRTPQGVRPIEHHDLVGQVCILPVFLFVGAHSGVDSNGSHSISPLNKCINNRTL
jgi:hypothetical protein